MGSNIFRNIAIVLCVAATVAAVQSTKAAPWATTMNVNDFDDIASHHPAGDALRRLFGKQLPGPPGDFSPTGLKKKDYLRLVAGNVDFWKQHQTAEGAIVDFYEKDAKHPEGTEKQYSTPAFALAAAELVQESGRKDLLDPAVRAFSFALTALVNKTTANQHADFYIPMLIHAHRILKSRVPAETTKQWEDQFKSLVPEQNYRDVGGGGNWNLVNVSGEAMRRKDHLVATTQMAPQQAYLDRMLTRQQRHFTKYGMYEDANVPLAYDAFPRLWMEDMIADGAYADGSEHARVEQFLALGSFSSLLLMSPQGEWACGGRSAHHQWNEAECAVIAEINAARWKARGRDDIAGAFKRMARMGLKSMLRWQRPSGEMWIVKNFASPEKRFGFEGYSFNSQYNLLPMAMLCIAYERANESVDERPLPSEYGTYVFDLSDAFTKVCAASGGYYVLIDTTADPHYNGTGLQRIHRRGVELSPLTDSAGSERVIGALQNDAKVALTPGLQWRTEKNSPWISLADFGRFEPPPKAKPGEKQQEARLQKSVKKAALKIESTDDRAAFTISYQLDGSGAQPIVERYAISGDGVEASQMFGDGAKPVTSARFAFPAMINDGAKDTEVSTEGSKLRVRRNGGELTVELKQPGDAKLLLAGPRVATHNGYLQAACADVQDPAAGVVWRARLEPAPLTPVK